MTTAGEGTPNRARAVEPRPRARPPVRIAIAAASAYTPLGARGPWFDDQRLHAELTARGHQVEIVGWDDAVHDPLRFDAMYVSSTWNGCAEPMAFVAWLDTCESDGRRRLINDRAVLDAGFVKHRHWRLLERALASSPSLRELGRLTPSRFVVEGPDAGDGGIEPRGGRRLADVLADLDRDPAWASSNVVLKPTVSADGIDTFVYDRIGHAIPVDDAKRDRYVLQSAADADATFVRMANDRARHGALVQPYMQGVEAGEYSLTVLGSRCTHAVQKPPLFKGDGSGRRVFVELERLPGTMLAFAEALVGALVDHFGAGSVSRARVDLFDEGGVPVLCELECVDPNTNLRVVAEHDASRAEVTVQTYADVIEERAAALAAEPGAVATTAA